MWNVQRDLVSQDAAFAAHVVPARGDRGALSRRELPLIPEHPFALAGVEGGQPGLRCAEWASTWESRRSAVIGGSLAR